MTDFNDIKRRLRVLTENRNYFFKDTTRTDAENYLKNKTEFEGLTPKEIQDLELSLRRSFPDDFRQYLLELGRNCGELFCLGQDINPEKFIEYQEWAKEIIEDEQIDSFLTGNTIIFFFHQGYWFYYFDMEGKNCPIYLYVEGDKEPQKIFDNFSELLESELQYIEKANSDGQNSDGYFLTISNGVQHMDFPSKNSGIKPREIGDQFI